MSIYHSPKFQEDYSSKLVSCELIKTIQIISIKTFLPPNTYYDYREEKLRMSFPPKLFSYSHRVNSLFTKPVFGYYNMYNTATTLSAFSRVSRNLGGFFMPASLGYT